MELTYSRYREDFILDALGLDLDEAGYVVHDGGGYVETVCGKNCLRIDEVGAYAHVEDAPNEVKLVCDDISCIVNWQSDRDLDRS